MSSVRIFRIAAVVLYLLFCSIELPAAIIGVGKFSGTTTVSGIIDSNQVAVTVGLANSVPSGTQYANPRLFSNRPFNLSDDGSLLVATSATDPFFNTWASTLTDGKSQGMVNVSIWPYSTSSVVYQNEAHYFGLPTGTVDFQGKTIKSLALQVNYIDKFDYQSTWFGSPVTQTQYTFNATLLVSDTESVTAPVIPVAIPLAARNVGVQMNLGDSLLLDASNSVGDIAQYEWDLNGDQVFDITTTQSQVLLSPAEYAPYLKPSPRAGDIRWVNLRVTDNLGVTSTDISNQFSYVPEPSVFAPILMSTAIFIRRRRHAGA